MNCLAFQLPVAAFVVIVFSTNGFAQSATLPRPSQTIYKCIDHGRIIYSDNPCPGAEKIDAKPSNGFSKWSGRERVGTKIQHERMQEKIGEALRPITGMNPKQFKQYQDRFNLPVDSKLKCQTLDSSISRSEAAEPAAQGPAKIRLQNELYEHRRQYRELRC